MSRVSTAKGLVAKWKMKPKLGMLYRRRRVKGEGVERPHQILQMVLLETDEAGQRWRVATSTIKAVYHVAFLLFPYQQYVPHFQLALSAVMRRFVLGPAVEADFDSSSLDELQHTNGLTQSLQ